MGSAAEQVEEEKWSAKTVAVPTVLGSGLRVADRQLLSDTISTELNEPACLSGEQEERRIDRRRIFKILPAMLVAEKRQRLVPASEAESAPAKSTTSVLPPAMRVVLLRSSETERPGPKAALVLCLDH